MSNTEGFEEKDGELDTAFDGTDDATVGIETAGLDEGDFEELGPEEDGFGDEAVPPQKKSGGSGKFLVLLLIILLGGGAAAVKLELVQLPIDIPGLTPETTTQVAANTPVPAPLDLELSPEETPSPGVANDTPGATDSAKKENAGMMPNAINQEEEKEPKITAPGSDPFGDPFADLGDTPGGDQNADPFGDMAVKSEADPLMDSTLDPLNMGEPPADEIETVLNISASSTTKEPDVAVDPFADPAVDMMHSDSLGMEASVETVDIIDDADPFATPGGPDMAAMPVVPVETASAVTPPPDSAKDSQIMDLKNRVKVLEKELATANKRANAAEKETSSLSAKLTKAESRVATKSADTSSLSSAPQKTAASTVSKSKPAPRWVLKSAKPGVAWVAIPGSVALKTISVGETLSGIGKIKAVSKDSAGRWVVSGTQGNIRQ